MISNSLVRTVWSLAVVVTLGSAVVARPATTTVLRSNPTDGTYGTYLVGQLAAACGYEARVALGRGPVAYAQAATIDDRAIILYNPRSLDALERETGTPWASVSVIAHELGHHYFGHAHHGMRDAEAGTILQHELDADYFSGYAIARVGGTLVNAQAAQRLLKSDETLYHPSSERRLHAIRAGWLDGAGGLPLSPEPWLRMERDNPVRALLLRASTTALTWERLSLHAGKW